MSVLVLADHDNASLKDSTLAAVTAATQIGGDVHVLVAGDGADAAAAAAAQVAGVAKVLLANHVTLANGLAENVAPLVAGLMANYSALVATSSTFGKNVTPRVAALLDVAQVSDILSVESPTSFTRPIYGGQAIATVSSGDAKVIVTIRPTAFAKAVTGGSAPVEAIGGAADAGISSFVGAEKTVSARPDLTAAKIIVSGGRALASADNFHSVIEPLADKLGAAVGASRAAVDAGYMPNDYQVGQTGKIVAPELYVAVGISGAIQHLAGMKDSKVIVAINKDEEAPIFQVADYGLVGDLFTIVPELTAKLG
ncbi:electron transfer flavoprotein subunit alpha/FixB family protein [Sandaracinobacteroides saxicola]|uniref:Electron transfer flavoprotein subunit alpha n=1 Tax=Sandaracinobacteroides saxicola TaxID=2759707 RepID=A0A7G5II05_9SPHN|nr:FAD-binding protein [Sandaracinobacteroides saxicola]QMW22997.1 electron transfer flavoprotein subunit alpha/FixB family protein [Sandaracinobacteroides saxicola]